jgi:hypothetical protein
MSEPIFYQGNPNDNVAIVAPIVTPAVVSPSVVVTPSSVSPSISPSNSMPSSVWFQDMGNGNFTTPWNPTGASPDQKMDEWIDSKHSGTSFEDQSWRERSDDRVIAAYETAANPVFGVLGATGQALREASDIAWAGIGESARVVGASAGGYDLKQIESVIAQNNDLAAKIESSLKETSDPVREKFAGQLKTLQDSLDALNKQKDNVTFSKNFEDMTKKYEKSDFVGKEILSDSALMLATMKLPSLGFLGKATKGADLVADVASTGKKLVGVVDSGGDVARVIKEIPTDAPSIFKLADEVIGGSRYADDVLDVANGIKKAVPLMNAEQKAIASEKYLKLLDKFADEGLYFRNADKVKEAQQMIDDLPSLVEDLTHVNGAYTPAGQKLMNDASIIQKALSNKAANVVNFVGDVGANAGARANVGARANAPIMGWGGALNNVASPGAVAQIVNAGGGGAGRGVAFVNAANRAVSTKPYVLARQGLNVVREVVGNTITVGAGGTIAAVAGATTLQDDKIENVYANASKVALNGKSTSNITQEEFEKMQTQHETASKDLKQKWSAFIDPKTNEFQTKALDAKWAALLGSDGKFKGDLKQYNTFMEERKIADNQYATYKKEVDSLNALGATLEGINQKNQVLLKDYLYKDSAGKDQIDVAKMIKNKGEAQATLLLAQTGYKPEIPSDVYAKLDDTAKKYYTEGKGFRMSSLVYSSKTGLEGLKDKTLGYIGRFEEQVRIPWEEKMKQQWKSPLSDVPILGMADPVNLAFGIGEVIDPWAAVAKNYQTMGDKAIWGATPFAGPAIRSWQAVGDLPANATLDQNLGAWGGAAATTIMTALPIVGGPIGSMIRSKTQGWSPTGKLATAVEKAQGVGNALARPVNWINEKIMYPIGDSVAPFSNFLEKRLTQIKVGDLGERGAMWGWWADKAVPSPLNPIKTVRVDLEGGGQQKVFQGVTLGKFRAGFTESAPEFVINPVTGKRVIDPVTGQPSLTATKKKFVLGSNSDDLFLPEGAKGRPLPGAERMNDPVDAYMINKEVIKRDLADAIAEKYGYHVDSISGKPEAHPITDDWMTETMPTPATRAEALKLLSQRRIAEGWAPRTKIEDTLFDDKALKRVMSEGGVKAVNAIKESMDAASKARFRDTDSFKAKDRNIEIPKMTTMDPDVAKEILKIARRSGKLDLLYGSSTIDGQIAAAMKNYRTKGDFDFSLNMTSTETKKLMSQFQDVLEAKYGVGKIRVNPSGEFTLQRKMPDVRNADGTTTAGEWKNVIDSHPAGRYSYDVTVEMAYGRKFSQNPTLAKMRGEDTTRPDGTVLKGEKIGQIPIMRLSETGARKMGSGMGGYAAASQYSLSPSLPPVVVLPALAATPPGGRGVSGDNIADGEFYEVQTPMLNAPSPARVMRTTITPELDVPEVAVARVSPPRSVVNTGRSVAEVVEGEQVPSRAVANTGRSLVESPSSNRAVENVPSRSVAKTSKPPSPSPSPSPSSWRSPPYPSYSPSPSPYSPSPSPYSPSPYSPSPYSPYSPSPYSPSIIPPPIVPIPPVLPGAGGGGGGGTDRGGGPGPALNPIYDLTNPVSLVMPRFSFMGQSLGMITDEDLTEFGVSKSAMSAKRSHDYVNYLSPVSKQVGASVFASGGGNNVWGGAQGFASSVVKSAGNAAGNAVGKIAKRIVG